MDDIHDPTDVEELDAYRGGDVAAFERLVLRHRPTVYGYLLYMTGNRADADDAFQETWLRVLRNCERFRAGHFRGWLMRIAHNVAIDRHRRRPVESLDAEQKDGQSHNARLADQRPGPRQNAEAAELGRLIMRRVATLPADQREVFLLRSQSALPFAEIARIQGVPLNTALGRMHYAVKSLRKDLAPLWPLGRNEIPRGKDTT